MADEHKKGALGGGLPWGFVLDPAANARALGDVQRRGLQAARELVDRVLSTIDHSGEPAADSPLDDAASSGPEKTPPLEDLIQGWWDLAAQVLTAMATAPGTGPGPSERPAPSARPITVDVTSQGTPTLWRLRAASNGELAAPTELWLRNPSSLPVGPLRLSVGNLLASDGTPLGSSCLRFDPPEVELPARSARCVVPTLAGQPLVPGTYRGVVQAEGAPNLWVTLDIAVESGPA
jgi:hypothetical protein